MLKGGDRKTLTPGRNKAENNLIHDWLEVYHTYSAAVSISGVGNICCHNEMHTSPHVAVIYGGNDHLIEYNYIHDVVRHSNDAGAIYGGLDWTQQGTIIRYNCLKDIGSEKFKPEGIYWDDELSGQTAYGNILINVGSKAFLVGGGRDNKVYNNLLINNGIPIHYDDRGRDGFVHNGWARASVNTKQSVMWVNLYKMPYNSSLWAERYPTLSKVTDDFADYDNPDFPVNPAYSIVKDNVIIGNYNSEGHIAGSVRKYSIVENNLIFAPDEDIGFVDAGDENYTLKEDSKIFKLIPGFENIPLAKIGRY